MKSDRFAVRTQTASLSEIEP